MKLPQQVIDTLLNADGKALATRSENDVNVVPVSMVKMQGDNILLINCFMGKTVGNLMKDPHVSLACWKGKEGYQIKASAEYADSGNIFDEARQWVAGTSPERVVKGVLVLEPIEIFDVSPNIDKAGKRVE